MYFVPNLANDAHDTNITDLSLIVEAMLGNLAFMKNALIIGKFDGW